LKSEDDVILNEVKDLLRIKYMKARRVSPPVRKWYIIGRTEILHRFAVQNDK